MSKPKISILDLPIRLYQPMTEGDPYLAVIGTENTTLPILIKGNTPMQAQMKAENWRQEEHARVVGKKAQKQTEGVAS